MSRVQGCTEATASLNLTYDLSSLLTLHFCFQTSQYIGTDVHYLLAGQGITERRHFVFATGDRAADTGQIGKLIQRRPAAMAAHAVIAVTGLADLLVNMFPLYQVWCSGTLQRW